MKFRNPNKKIKAMAFGGDSFTWGQELWHYMGSDVPPPTQYHCTPVHHVFREKYRYPNLVAEAFDTVAITREGNGGANDHTVEYWTNCFTEKNKINMRNFHRHEKPLVTIQPINYSDISHFVFQFTQWGRSGINLWIDGGYKIMDVQSVWGGDDDPRRNYRTEFFNWLNTNISSESEAWTFHKFQQYMVNRDLANIKEFLYNLEQNGIKTYMWSWPHEYVQAIQEGNDQWLADRLISFEYTGKTYRCIEEMMRNEKNMTIATDLEFFEDPIQDGHPSLLCHKIIAENVINFIKRRDNEK